MTIACALRLLSDCIGPTLALGPAVTGLSFVPMWDGALAVTRKPRLDFDLGLAVRLIADPDIVSETKHRLYCTDCPGMADVLGMGAMSDPAESAQCPHTPNCYLCLKCGEPVPDYYNPGRQGPDAPGWRVRFENDVKYFIPSGICQTEEAARAFGISQMGRSARLCVKHLVRITEVEKL